MSTQLIKHNFSQAAPHYLTNAAIQSAPATKIIERLGNYYRGGTILDRGSGPGTLAHQSERHYPFLAFDLSLAMLHQAQTRHKINGDASQLPFAEHSFPLIISNLMLQWPEDKMQVMAEAYRVLQPGGTLIVTTLIKPSLAELQQAWQQVDDHQHTLEFLTLADYVLNLQQIGFKLLETENWQTTVYFPSLAAVFKHFKATGTSLAKSACNRGLGGKRQLQQLEQAYSRVAAGLPLTYAYLLLVATKATGTDASERTPGFLDARVPLDQVTTI